MGQKTDYFNKANTLLFLFSLKKIASKIDKQVMLSYLLLFNKRLEFNFFLNSIQNSHVHEPSIAAFTYYHREKLNLKSLS